MSTKSTVELADLVINKRNYDGLSREDLIKAITDLQKRVGLITDFNQCEMDERNTCNVCNLPFHPDYCFDRINEKNTYNDKQTLIYTYSSEEPINLNTCDVCADQKY